MHHLDKVAAASLTNVHHTRAIHLQAARAQQGAYHVWAIMRVQAAGVHPGVQAAGVHPGTWHRASCINLLVRTHHHQHHPVTAATIGTNQSPHEQHTPSPHRATIGTNHHIITIITIITILAPWSKEHNTWSTRDDVRVIWCDDAYPPPQYTLPPPRQLPISSGRAEQRHAGARSGGQLMSKSIRLVILQATAKVIPPNNKVLC